MNIFTSINYKLPSEDSIKLTVARYLVNGKHWIHDVGVTPDVAVGDLAQVLEPDDPVEALRYE